MLVKSAVVPAVIDVVEFGLHLQQNFELIMSHFGLRTLHSVVALNTWFAHRFRSTGSALQKSLVHALHSWENIGDSDRGRTVQEHLHATPRVQFVERFQVHPSPD